MKEARANGYAPNLTDNRPCMGRAISRQKKSDNGKVYKQKDKLRKKRGSYSERYPREKTE